jgi:hypothetical protein
MLVPPPPSLETIVRFSTLRNLAPIFATLAISISSVDSPRDAMGRAWEAFLYRAVGQSSSRCLRMHFSTGINCSS